MTVKERYCKSVVKEHCESVLAKAFLQERCCESMVKERYVYMKEWCTYALTPTYTTFFRCKTVFLHKMELANER